ncbi:hypothetical protein L484_011732 [Morus notabilis]|uniref:DUF4228 domain-containing protein n=1 Tax=Morus notabilis TaxID=981085 RepID=W9RLG8_9ROSA|nr:uncharacterized protein LOC21394975 [Morus notabilis]EXB96692.1 hypothetical protein L484_011732 [Morus notabilis]
MGICASSETQSKRSRRDERRPSSSSITDRIRRVPRSSSKVIHAVDGRLQEYKPPIQAKHVTSKYQSCFLSSSESMSIGTCVPRVPDDEDLQPGQIYFLFPESQAQKPLSLPDLCSLAIKASSALSKSGVDFSSNTPKLTTPR